MKDFEPKRLCSLLAVVCLSFFAINNLKAQSTPRIIVGAGANVANVWYANEPFQATPPETRSSITGLLIFGSVEFQLSDLWFLAPQVTYIQKGARFDNLYFNRGSMRFDMEYFQVMSKFALKLGPERIKLCLFASPGIGINVASTLTEDVMSNTGALTSVTISMRDETEPLEFVLDVGTGIEIVSAERTSLSLNTAYSFGLTRWNNGGNTQGYSESRGLHFFAGLGFRL